MARYESINHPHLLVCVCGKTYATTRDEARRLRREIVAFKGNKNTVRFSEFSSGGWHWTSQVERVRS